MKHLKGVLLGVLGGVIVLGVFTGMVELFIIVTAIGALLGFLFSVLYGED